MNAEPIIPGFFPDPSICRAGGRYYVATSSFEYLPGVAIHSSTDLVTWTHIGNALDTRDHLDLRGAPSGAGIYAPNLRYREGLFYLTTTDIGSVLAGQLISTATDPAGPWSLPVRVPVGMGIDPDLFWDEDGTCYLTWVGFDDSGTGRIMTMPIDPRTGQSVGERRLVWQGTGLTFPEGPHLYRVGGYLYCMLAEGGTERGHVETIARATSLDGPWEPSPRNPILTHRSTGHPV